LIVAFIATFDENRLREQPVFLFEMPVACTSSKLHLGTVRASVDVGIASMRAWRRIVGHKTC
jgi:hypothetical protein